MGYLALDYSGVVPDTCLNFFTLSFNGGNIVEIAGYCILYSFSSVLILFSVLVID
jgi:hypothetical protein